MQRLQFLCSLYHIDQLINEPTRLTATSTTLIDFILTNKPENISHAGFTHLRISYYCLVFAVRKPTLPKSRQILKEVGDFKNLVENDFIEDISQLP